MKGRGYRQHRVNVVSVPLDVNKDSFLQLLLKGGNVRFGGGAVIGSKSFKKNKNPSRNECVDWNPPLLYFFFVCCVDSFGHAEHLAQLRWPGFII